MMKPETEDEVAGAVGAATEPLHVVGGGTRAVGRPVPGEVLNLSNLSGITLYEPEALTVVARAGTRLADLEAALSKEGQRLAFEPADWRGLLGHGGHPTVGGMVAANISGSRRVQAGACRDALLGVRFVDGTGAIVKNGGRVMKNVTGYDLVKLMAGSWGTLGVLTEVALKVLPVPAAAATLVVSVEGATAAVAAMSAALGSPHDVTGAAFVPGEGVLIRIEGFAASVEYRADKLEELLVPHGPVRIETDPVRVSAVWKRVTNVTLFAEKGGDVWRLSVRPSDAPALLAGLACEYMLDWGGGLIWALLPEGEDARARLGQFKGHATLIRASEDTRARIAPFHPEPPALAKISADLRARFDPKGILNPGLMG